VQRLLVGLGGDRSSSRKLSEPAVIVSQDLLPSAVAELNLDFARGVVTDSGGWTSHTSIIARGLGIPAIVGLRNFYRHARTGDMIIVDSSNSEAILNPTANTLARYEERLTAKPSAVSKPESVSGPLVTADGIKIRLRANVELPSEFAGVAKYGAQGIGLYRSEFLLSSHSAMLSEDEQVAAYIEIGKLAGSDGAIIRLFDLGAERSVDISGDSVRNPALGLRAIRYGLSHPQVLKTQVRAIMRAAAGQKLAIVLPMVADISDIRRARNVIDEQGAALDHDGIARGHVRVGAMIEIPSAMITASKIAQAVDFFELGTNDLVQYTLAVDRGNQDVADWFRTLHPAVLFGINQTLQAAVNAKIPAIVCGEMASTPTYAVLLIGMGAVDLSMTPSAMPRVRQVLSKIDSIQARAIAEECLKCESADEVESLVRTRYQALWPELFRSANLPASRN
jgi:phosphotransferase system enzyme I (PtsI)